MAAQTDNRNATQRIEDLEEVAKVTYNGLVEVSNVLRGLANMQGDLNLIKDALKLLNKKTEAIIQTATPETGITVDSVTALVTKMNVVDLTAQVAQYVANGQLTLTDTATDDSYLVCEESNSEGKLVNPRIQFRMDSVDPATKTALSGKKVGDLVSTGEGKYDVKILEIYTILPPKASETAPAAEASAPATEALETAVAPATEAAAPAPELASLPTETPVTEFVPSDLSNAITANS